MRHRIAENRWRQFDDDSLPRTPAEKAPGQQMTPTRGEEVGAIYLQPRGVGLKTPAEAG